MTALPVDPGSGRTAQRILSDLPCELQVIFVQNTVPGIQSKAGNLGYHLPQVSQEWIEVHIPFYLGSLSHPSCPC